MQKRYVIFIVKCNGDQDMKGKKKTTIYTILLCVIAVAFSYFYAYIDKNIYLYDRNADTGTFQDTGILAEGETITQEFVSKEDTIDGVNIKISLAGNVEDVMLHYALMDTETKQIVENKIPAVQLKNKKFNQLGISQITEAKGREYELILSVENADEQNGIGFYLTQDEMLVTRVICHGFDMETFVVSAGILVFVYAFMTELYKAFR